MKIGISVLLLMFSLAALAQDFSSLQDLPSLNEVDREPASVTSPTKRLYPGGQDEEDLRVLSALPEATLKTDSRSLQRPIFKSLYNQEMKEDRHEEAVEE